MEATGFVFQRSYYEALRGLDDASRLAVLDAITDYAFTGKEPENLQPLPLACFTLIRPTIDSSLSRYAACVANGKRGGRPKKPKENQAENQSKTKMVKPKQNLNKDKNKDMDTLPLTGGKVIQSEEYVF